MTSSLLSAPLSLPFLSVLPSLLSSSSSSSVSSSLFASFLPADRPSSGSPSGRGRPAALDTSGFPQSAILSRSLLSSTHNPPTLSPCSPSSSSSSSSSSRSSLSVRKGGQHCQRCRERIRTRTRLFQPYSCSSSSSSCASRSSEDGEENMSRNPTNTRGRNLRLRPRTRCLAVKHRGDLPSSSLGGKDAPHVLDTAAPSSSFIKNYENRLKFFSASSPEKVRKRKLFPSRLSLSSSRGLVYSTVPSYVSPPVRVQV